jgi:hypothetical protein
MHIADSALMFSRHDSRLILAAPYPAFRIAPLTTRITHLINIRGPLLLPSVFAERSMAVKADRSAPFVQVRKY